MKSRATRLGVAVVGVVVLAAACTPGKKASTPTQKPTSAISTNVTAAGPVTLTVWDQEVRGGQNAEITQLNKEFHDKYPNVTIKRNSKSFTNLKDTLKLALSGANPPDVVEANQGYPDMGAFVQAGMLQPLDSYAQRYDWTSRYPATLLNLNSFTPDGKSFGTGTLYGISQTGEIVGIYYNKQKLARVGLSVPATWADFEADLPKIKAAGQLPIMFGNKDQWPAIHEFGVLQEGRPRPGLRQGQREVGFPAIAGGGHEAARLGAERLPQPRHERPRLRRGGDQVRQGQRRLPDHRHVGGRRPAEVDGQEPRLHAAAARYRRRRLGDDRRAGPGLVDHREVEACRRRR